MVLAYLRMLLECICLRMGEVCWPLVGSLAQRPVIRAEPHEGIQYLVNRITKYSLM